MEEENQGEVEGRGSDVKYVAWNGQISVGVEQAHGIRTWMVVLFGLGGGEGEAI
jgi:hypothetical protein